MPDAEVYVFGSRAHGKGLKPFSDLDLLVKSHQALSVIDIIKTQQAFSESDLPFSVDISQQQDLDEAFYRAIENDLRLLN